MLEKWLSGLPPVTSGEIQFVVLLVIARLLIPLFLDAIQVGGVACAYVKDLIDQKIAEHVGSVPAAYLKDLLDQILEDHPARLRRAQARTRASTEKPRREAS